MALPKQVPMGDPRRMLVRRGWLWHIVVILLVLAQPAQGCPLCEALGSTLRDDLQVASVALLGTVRGCTPTEVSGVYQIRLDADVTWLKYASVSPQELRLQSLSELQRGGQVLVLGFDAACEREEVATASLQTGKEQEWVWVPPVAVSNQTAKYLTSMPPPDTPEEERLLYFFEHLSSIDRLISDDAYNECARASLPAVQSRFFLDRVDLAEVLLRIRDPQTPDRYKSFYWMLLAEKGNQQHTELFRELADPWLKRGESDSDQNATRLIEYPAWLPAAMATFIRLGGEPAIQHVEESVLKNQNADMPLVFYAVSAFRALGNDLKAVDRSRLAQSFEILVDQPRVADLIIADLARWEHWGVIPKLRALFDQVDPDTTFVRTPIINFLRSCPLPEAATELEYMQAADPKAYRRAVTLLPTLETPTAPK